MLGIRIFGSFLGLCFFSSVCIATTPQQALTKKRVIADLESIRNIFEVKYAPLKWKKEFSNWDLDEAYLQAKAKLSYLNDPSLKDCQVILRDFFNTTKDYHVGVKFYSTEAASLPFQVKGSQNHYFITYIDKGQVSLREFPFEVGDEILTFNGSPIHETIQAFRFKEFGDNTSETDQALAEMSLTHRKGELGMHIPSGNVVITGKRQSSDKIIKATLNWAYHPEKIKDFSKLGATHLQLNTFDWQQDWKSALRESSFFDKYMVAHFWDKPSVSASLEANKHALGARTSYVPALGKKIWHTGSDAIFDAYIFKSPSGKSIGYIRIPHYVGDEEEVEEFGQVMDYFQRRTDALVIDQINNPGGSVFYLYGLAAILTDTPLYAPKHHIALTQEEVYTAVYLLPYLEQIKDDAEAHEVFGETLGGYPVDYEFIKLTKQFCQFLIDEWNQGKLYTDPTFLFGVEKIKPHPTYSYKKPVLVLINSLDFSGGDFFPAILQDNERAVLFGTRTAGAGGYVLGTDLPNHSGIKAFALTGSLAMRINDKPIENLGVTPDIPYEITQKDLQENYKDYGAAILNAIESLAAKP